MNKLLKLVVFLAVTIIGIWGMIYFSKDILILIKGIVGLVALLLVVAIVIGLIERIKRSSQVDK